MKVSKCSPQVNTSGLSWGEMVEKEGVYRTADIASEGRLIVLKVQDEVVVLYCGYGSLEPAQKSAWEIDSGVYFPTNETVCFDLKPA